jgi:hypothetical protein
MNPVDVERPPPSLPREYAGEEQERENPILSSSVLSASSVAHSPAGYGNASPSFHRSFGWGIVRIQARLN